MAAASQFLPLFPDLQLYPGYSIHKRPTFLSTVQTPPSGREVTGFQQALALWEFEIPFEILRDQNQNDTKFAPTKGFTELQILSQFYTSRFGPYSAFIYQDPTDFSRSGQIVGIGDGVKSGFLMGRAWGSGATGLTEPVGIVDVRAGKVLSVYLDGVPLSQPGNWVIGGDLRTLRLTSPPGNNVIVSADFSYFYFCRFIDESADLEQFMTGWWTVRGLKFRSTRPDIGNVVTIYTIADQDMDIAPTP